MLFTDAPKEPNLSIKEFVKEKELYTITCTVESSPMPTLTLSRSSLTNLEKEKVIVKVVISHILKFNHTASVSDAGVYTCTAENSEGGNYTQKKLTVWCK